MWSAPWSAGSRGRAGKRPRRPRAWRSNAARWRGSVLRGVRSARARRGRSLSAPAFSCARSASPPLEGQHRPGSPPARPASCANCALYACAESSKTIFSSWSTAVSPNTRLAQRRGWRITKAAAASPGEPIGPSDSVHVLLRHRLLREPHRFESLIAAGVGLEAHDQLAADREFVCARELYRHTALLPRGRHPDEDEHALVVHIEERSGSKWIEDPPQGPLSRKRRSASTPLTVDP